MTLSIIQTIQVALNGLEQSTADLQEEQRLQAALNWIKRAYAATSDGGISKGYDLLRGHWSPSYPETTGYTIPTLLNLADFFEQGELRDMAFALADFLLNQATPDGGVVHWSAGSDTEPYPIVFDTGQVMFGWVAAYEASNNPVYLEVATRAGDWLASVQDSSGAWLQFQHLGVEKVIDTRVAWAMLRLHRHTQKDTHRQAAIANLDWAVAQQDADGWFNHCAFTKQEDPFTHTLAYTAEGLYECGQLLREPRYIAASQLMANALIARQRPDGSLASTYASGWRATSRSSCLTGNCQMSHLWLRFYRATQIEAYHKAAQKCLGFVTRTQKLNGSNAHITGAIAGSYPIYGIYERMKYPNWATKFYIDALLSLLEVKRQSRLITYVG